MTTVVLETDHPGQAAALLLSQDRLHPGAQGLLRALMQSVQRLEVDLFDLYTSLNLDYATGAALDRVGSWVNEPRGVLTDDIYRLVIRVKLFALTASSNTDDMLAIVMDLSAPSTVLHWPLYPAGGQIQIQRSAFMGESRASRLARLAEIVRPAGVALLITEAVVDGFGFDDDPTALGFDEGIFSEVI